jgi:hypothetical protein
MTTQPQVQRTELVTLDKFVPNVAGRDGPQWELHLLTPWTKYPQQFWVAEGMFSEPNVGQQYLVTFTKGRLKAPGPDGQVKDPSLDWNYRWFIAAWDVSDEERVTYTPPDGAGYTPSADTNGSAPRVDHTRVSIERQVALKAAVELAVAQQIMPESIGAWVEYMASCIAGDMFAADIPSPNADERGGINDSN